MNKKFVLLSFISILLLSIWLPQTAQAVEPIDEKLGVPIVALGANLSEDEKANVLNKLNVSVGDDYEQVTVTGQDLIKYIPNGNGNARMFSSAKITRLDEGKGLTVEIVTPENITQVTRDMYATAILTAGVEDAKVEVAAPKAVTGHSALVGIYKAYEDAGGTLDTERTNVANDELSVATKLAEQSNVNKDEVAQLLTEIKKQIAEQAPATKEDVERIVNEQLSKFKIELSEEDRQLLIDLMDRIRGLDIDFSKLSDQMTDLANKLKDKIGSIEPGFWESVKQFFVDIFDKIKSWFKS